MLGFLRNEETIFSVERCSYFFFGLFCKMENIGDDVEKIRIGHDGSGLGAGWYLAKVEVRKFISSGKVKETTSHLDASFIFLYEGVCLCVYKIAGWGWGVSKAVQQILTKFCIRITPVLGSILGGFNFEINP